jgi:acetyltransferase-like isoleucine patch superfamily enzyme
MRALLHISGSLDWPGTLNAGPWPLLPIGNRPLLEYWFELCVDLGIQDVKIVMSDFASEIEAYAGDGARWGLTIQYGFEQDEAGPVAYFRRAPAQWNDGLLHIRGPVFPSRTELYQTGDSNPNLSGLLLDRDGARVMIAQTPEMVSQYIGGATFAVSKDPCGLNPVVLTSASTYFDMNRNLVEGESRRYLTSGYQITADQCHIGANTVLPPTAKIVPPVMIGDNCRIGELTTIGPDVVIGNYVVVDQQTELEQCLVLDGSYIGRNMEIRKKIISGSHLYDVEHDVDMILPDPWLLGSTRRVKEKRDAWRALIGWIVALVAVMLMILPYSVFFLLIGIPWQVGDKRDFLAMRQKKIRLKIISAPPENPRRLMRIFYGLSLDRFPLLLHVLSGRLWLCGHTVMGQVKQVGLIHELPAYFPAAIGYEDIQSGTAHRVHSLFYLEIRSPLEDLRIFIKFIAQRLLFIWA